ncbi:hypothetical protein OUZ56_020570 [Daphnia magna]|uniref:Uncharacterized protein n=2 Tax=Daphnia magna TaxID=35525 RepID=A0ABQ9ZFK4_9CRUS|nr:hypothetical protein OUZ56_020570 [Daphnia magna]
MSSSSSFSGNFGTLVMPSFSVRATVMEDTLGKNPFDYIGNAVAYGYIIYKSDFFYIYSGTLPDGSMYTVEVDIDAVPPSHHDVPCQCVEEYAREVVEE